MSSYQAERQASIDHTTIIKHEGGLMWSQCKCGWESRKRDAYDNWQVTGSAKDGTNHTSQQVALAWKAYRKEFRAKSPRTGLQSDFQ